MIDTNYIIILVIILFVLSIVVITVCYNKKYKHLYENFESTSSNDNHNLIKGGNLLSSTLPHRSSLTPNNTELIRAISNPSTSTNAVEIKPSNGHSPVNHMKFKLKTDKNTSYKITLWVGNVNINKSNHLKGIVDFSYSSSAPLKCVDLKYKILDTVSKTTENKQTLWTNLSIEIKGDNLYMFLGYNKNSKNSIYFADIYMSKVFNLANDFKCTGGLKCMIIPAKTLTQSKTNTIVNIADTSQSFKSSENISLMNGSGNILGKTLKGMPSNTINTKQKTDIKQLSIVLTMDVLGQSKKQLHSQDSILTEEEEESLEYDVELLRLSGNQDTALELLLRYDDKNQCYLIIKLSGEIIGEPIQIPKTKLTHHIIYNINAPDKNGIEYYLNNSEEPSLKVHTKTRLYLDSEPIIINHTKTKDSHSSNNVNLYSLLIYNDALDHKTRSCIFEYISRDHNTSVPDTDTYTFQNCLNKTDNLQDNAISRNNVTADNATSGNNITSGNNGMHKYRSNNTHQNNNTYQNKDTYNECPAVYKHRGNHMVRVSYNTKYGKRYNLDKNNRYLVRNYGKNQSDARDTYLQNYPDCAVPHDLQKHKKPTDHSNSPFSLDNNPHTQSECYGVNWDMKNPHNMNMSDKCKRIVATHCENNHTDTGCSDWHPDNKNCPKSQKNRRHFQPADPRCRPGSHEIEDHPDYKKYIRRDKIPCWNCKL